MSNFSNRLVLFRQVEREITSGSHVSNHIYHMSNDKKFVVVSKEKSKYREWEQYLHDNFPFDLSTYPCRTLTPPSLDGYIKDPLLWLIGSSTNRDSKGNLKVYDENHLKLFGINNKKNYPINYGISKSIYEVGKNSVTRCCFTCDKFLSINHFAIQKVYDTAKLISKYCHDIGFPFAVCFSVDENGELYDDTIHLEYAYHDDRILKNFISPKSSLRKFLIEECGVVKEKIDVYDFKRYYNEEASWRQCYHIKIALSETKDPLVKFYRYIKY